MRAARVLVISATLLAGACASAPPQLFYQPPGTQLESYRRSPVELRIAAYPAYADASVGAVLFIHGGGWGVGGAGLPFYADWEKQIRRADLRAFAVEHRLPPRYRGRDQVEDIVAAVRYLQTNATRFGFPPDRIALVGFSSGGHLAVMAGLTLSRRRPGQFRTAARPVRAVVAYYAPLDPERLLQSENPEIRAILFNYLPAFDPGRDMRESVRLRESFYLRALKDISPLQNLHRDAPPMLLVHGDQDKLVPISQSQAFAERALELKPGLARLEIARGADHNFEASRSRWARALEEESIDFIIDQFEE